jgi:hypothetical protein
MQPQADTNNQAAGVNRNVKKSEKNFAASLNKTLLELVS